MKLKYAQQISFNEFEGELFDIVIAASGYEARATHLAKLIKHMPAKRVVIEFEELKNEQRIQNDFLFKEMGFIPFEANEGRCEDIINILNEALSEHLSQSQLNVLVDYSCMTKVWYASIINYFVHKHSEIENLNVTFSYTPSVYTDPLPHLPPNKYMGPVPGIYCVSASNKPTALILGLGYEKERAKGILEYLDSQVNYAFYSNPAFDSRFAETVEANNKHLLDSLGPDHVFQHPVDDLKRTDALLTSLCLSLRDNFRVILAPLGPKPFALMCLLLSARYPDIDVWRVSSICTDNIYERPAAPRDPVICKVTFVKEVKSVPS